MNKMDFRFEGTTCSFSWQIIDFLLKAKKIDIHNTNIDRIIPYLRRIDYHG